MCAFLIKVYNIITNKTSINIIMWYISLIPLEIPYHHQPRLIFYKLNVCGMY